MTLKKKLKIKGDMWMHPKAVNYINQTWNLSSQGASYKDFLLYI